jgi:hypothetical protein
MGTYKGSLVAYGRAKRSVFIYGENTAKRTKKKHNKGIVFRDWGGLKFGAVIFHVSLLYWLRGKDFGSC